MSLSLLPRKLDETEERILSGDATSSVIELSSYLQLIWKYPQVDITNIIQTCRGHRIHSLLLQDPYTARAFLKPRGYAGDAVMLDYIYFQSPPNNTTDIGKAIFRATTGQPNGLSVLERREILAEYVAKTLASVSKPTILSVACGHMRELELLTNMDLNEYEFIGFDQDKQSLSEVQACYGRLGVSTIAGSVIDLLLKRIEIPNCDLIYASGLFDYLNDKLAKKLIKIMYTSLNSGGKLIVANFTPSNEGRAYMECFMDWFLIFRSADLLKSIAIQLIGDVKRINVFEDVYRNIAYLELSKP